MATYAYVCKYNRYRCIYSFRRSIISTKIYKNTFKHNISYKGMLYGCVCKFFLNSFTFLFIARMEVKFTMDFFLLKTSMALLRFSLPEEQHTRTFFTRVFFFVSKENCIRAYLLSTPTRLLVLIFLVFSSAFAKRQQSASL